MALSVVSIPRFIDSQYQVFFWEMDELVPLIVALGAGIMFEVLLYALIFGLIFSVRFSRFKMARLDGVLVHFAYWVGMMALNKMFRNGLVREMIN